MFHLNGCRAKILRARQHCDVLELYAREAERPTLGLRFDADTSEYTAYISRCPDITRLLIDASLVFGDAVLNLRAALDHLVYQLALRDSSGPLAHPERLQFPICDFSSDFDDKKARNLEGIDDEHVRAIATFQPYDRVKSGGPFAFPLRHIRDISNSDKHRLLKVMVVPIKTANFLGEIPIPDIIGISGGVDVETVVLGAEFARFQFPGGQPLPDREVAGDLTVHICASDIRPHIPVNNLLRHLIAAVEEIIDSFEPLVCGSTPNGASG